MEIITEMPQLDDALTIGAMLDLLQREGNSGVRQQIVLMLGFMRTTRLEIKKVSQSLLAAYGKAGEPEERARIIEVISNLPTPESVRFIATVFGRTERAPEERIGAAEGLFKLAPRVAVEPGLRRQATDWLRQQAKTATTGPLRLAAARVLAAPGQDNQGFLAELAATETNPKVRKFLALASRHSPTE